MIDPRTGYPAGDLLSLTIISDSAADADAAATGYFVAGSGVVAEVAKEDGPLSMVAVRAGKRQDEVQQESFGNVDWVDPEHDF